jgi:hypothetical protein
MHEEDVWMHQGGMDASRGYGWIKGVWMHQEGMDASRGYGWIKRQATSTCQRALRLYYGSIKALLRLYYGSIKALLRLYEGSN